MKAKELSNIGIDRERIKYYKKKGVFTPEVPAKKIRRITAKRMFWR